MWPVLATNRETTRVSASDASFKRSIGGITMGDFIPPGFERCPRCGEFNGSTQARHLSWELPADPLQTPWPATDAWDWLQDQKTEIARTIDPNLIISVTCLCGGVPCRRCGGPQVPGL
jgi:hypothetical protein